MDSIMMSIMCNGRARCSGNNSCWRPKIILIVPMIQNYTAATRYRDENFWLMSGALCACANKYWSTVAATWSCPKLATIAVKAATAHLTAAAYTNTVSPAVCIQTNDRCWSKCCRRPIHKNIYMPAWRIISSCAWSNVAPTRTLLNTRTNTATRLPNIVMAPPKHTSPNAKLHPGMVRVNSN